MPEQNYICSKTERITTPPIITAMCVGIIILNFKGSSFIKQIYEEQCGKLPLKSYLMNF